MSASPTTTAALTSRERFLRALRGERADRVPVWLMRQAGRYLPGYQAMRARHGFLELCKTPAAAAEVSIEPLEAVGSDAVIIFNDIMLPLEHAGARVEFDDDGPVIRNPIRGLDDLGSLDLHDVRPDEPVAETIREVRRRVGEGVPILGFIGSPWTLTTYWVEGRLDKRFDHISSLRDNEPALLEALLEHVTKYAAAYLKVQIEAGADAVQIFDTWASLLNPTEYERLSARWIQEAAQAGRAAGVPVIVFVNGAAPHLPVLKTLDVDALSVDARVDLAGARRVLGPKMALQGNLKPDLLLEGPEAAERGVRRIFDSFPPGPGHIFNLGHGVLPGTSVEAVRRCIEAAKRFGAY